MTIDFKAMKVLENFLRSKTNEPFECRVVSRAQIFNNVQWIFHNTVALERFYVVSYDGYRNQWHITEYLPGDFQVIEGDD